MSKTWKEVRENMGAPTISTQHYVRLVDGEYQCCTTPDGKTPVDAGCRHPDPKSAARHAEKMNGVPQ